MPRLKYSKLGIVSDEPSSRTLTLPVPFGCLASDLQIQSTVQHRNGPVVDKIGLCQPDIAFPAERALIQGGQQADPARDQADVLARVRIDHVDKLIQIQAVEVRNGGGIVGACMPADTSPRIDPPAERLQSPIIDHQAISVQVSDDVTAADDSAGPYRPPAAWASTVNRMGPSGRDCSLVCSTTRLAGDLARELCELRPPSFERPRLNLLPGQVGRAIAPAIQHDPCRPFHRAAEGLHIQVLHVQGPSLHKRVQAHAGEVLIPEPDPAGQSHLPLHRPCGSHSHEGSPGCPQESPADAP